MCRVLGVSRSGFYKWRQKPVSRRAEQQKLLVEAVVETYSTYKACDGPPRVAQELKALGIPCSTNNAAHIMSSNGLKARNGKAFKYSRSGEGMTNVSDNLLWRDFKAGKPNTKWTSDITYIGLKTNGYI